MIFIKTDSTNPYFNLAAEEYLVQNKEDEVFMLWRNSPSVIVGRNQNTMAEIDCEYVREQGIPVVRRMSGGGAVFHDLENVNFTYIINGGEFGDYVGFTKSLRNYISELGIRTQISGRNDILADGRKFSGNAQYRWRERLMHHGTILIGADIGKLSKALKPEKTKIESKGIKSVLSRVVNLSELINVSAKEFMDGFEKAIKSEGNVTDYRLGSEDLATIEKLKEEKYRTLDWNFGYSPKYSYHNRKRFVGGSVEVYFSVGDGVITDAKIYGDFFSKCGVEGLVEAITGVRHDRDALLSVVSRTWEKDILGGITLDEFMTCMF